MRPTTDYGDPMKQWRHKFKKPENLGQCGRQNIFRPYLKICEWEWIIGHAVKAISSPSFHSSWLDQSCAMFCHAHMAEVVSLFVCFVRDNPFRLSGIFLWFLKTELYFKEFVAGLLAYFYQIMPTTKGCHHQGLKVNSAPSNLGDDNPYVGIMSNHKF